MLLFPSVPGTFPDKFKLQFIQVAHSSFAHPISNDESFSEAYQYSKGTANMWANIPAVVNLLSRVTMYANSQGQVEGSSYRASHPFDGADEHPAEVPSNVPKGSVPPFAYRTREDH